jgi:hypothetical protein
MQTTSLEFSTGFTWMRLFTSIKSHPPMTDHGGVSLKYYPEDLKLRMGIPTRQNSSLEWRQIC